MSIKNDSSDLLPKITCTSTKCEDDLHCFRPKKKTKPEILKGGNCHSCDANLVEWDVVHKRDSNNIPKTIEALKKEYIRDIIWNTEINIQVKDNYRKCLEDKISFKKNIVNILSKSIGKPGRKIFRDGTQTPFRTKNLVNLAQHATATCCRKCIKYWHDIPYEEHINATDLDYFAQLILNFIESKLSE